MRIFVTALLLLCVFAGCASSPKGPKVIENGAVSLTSRVTFRFVEDKASGSPEAEVHVALVRQGIRVAEGITDATGTFTATVPQGWYTLTATKGRSCPLAARLFFDEDEESTQTFPVLYPVTAVGTLKLGERGYPNAVLRLEDPEHPSCGATVTTDAEGRFVAVGVSPGADAVPIATRGTETLVLRTVGFFGNEGGFAYRVTEEHVFPLEVRLTDENGALLPDAAITVTPPEATKPGKTKWTVGTGSADFVVARPGTYRVVATVFSDDEDRVVWKDVQVDREHRAVTLVPEPRPRGARMAGTIHDEFGRPAAGIKVFATTVRAVAPADDAHFRPREVSRESVVAVTARDGSFVLDRLRQDHVYRVTTTEHEDDEDEVYACPGTTDIALKHRTLRHRQVRLRGRLVDTNGQPVTEAEILGPPTKIGPDGRFDFLAWGGFEWVEAPGYARRVISSEDANESSDVDVGDVVFERVRNIHGRVVRFDGQPAGGVEGSLHASERVDLWRSTSFKTSSDGTFTVPEFAAGRVQVKVFSAEAGVGTAELPKDVSEVELRLQSPASVTGTIVDANGRPGSGAGIGATCARGARDATSADEDGRFALRGLLGDCRLTGAEVVTPTGRRFVPEVRLSLQPGEMKVVDLRIRYTERAPQDLVDLRVVHPFRSHYRSAHLFRGEVNAPLNPVSWEDYEPGSVPEYPEGDYGGEIVARSASDEWAALEPGTYTLFVLEPRSPIKEPIRRVLHLDKPGVTVVYPQLGDHPLECGGP